VNLARSLARHAAAIAALSAPVFGIADATAAALPERVTFVSADGRTTLVGYVFRPEVPHAARTPAVVMMHAPAPAYSSLANGKYGRLDAVERHQQWGHLWAQQGYLAILVDGFGRAATRTAFPASATRFPAR
jgi:carboxymethylenebutenolidase